MNPRFHRHHVILLAPAIVALFIAGCKKDDATTAPESPAHVIMPLAVGKEWHYADTSFGQSGSSTVTYNTLAIVGSSEVQYQGSPVQLYHYNWQPPSPQVGKMLVCNDAAGLCSYGALTAIGTTILGKDLMVKYPAVVGDNWRRAGLRIYTNGSVTASDTITITCVATNETLVTPAGTFHCYVYSYQNLDTTVQIESRNYYAVDIGSVGYTRVENGVLTFKRVLIPAGADTVNPPTPLVNVTGTWSGSFSTNLVASATITFTLAQSGTTVTGAYASASGASGSVNGTISGSTIIFTLTQTTASCPGTFSGTATVSGNTMTFTLSGHDCLGDHYGGNGTVTR
jgi:hypothetical protein